MDIKQDGIEMSSVKVTSGAPVGLSTRMMKLAGARLVSSSSKPVSETSDAPEVGTSTGEYLPNHSENIAQPFAPAQEEDERIAATYVSHEAFLTYESADSSYGALFSPQDAVRQVGSYETAQEAAEPSSPKKSTKAFG